MTDWKKKKKKKRFLSSTQSQKGKRKRSERDHMEEEANKTRTRWNSLKLLTNSLKKSRVGKMRRWLVSKRTGVKLIELVVGCFLWGFVKRYQGEKLTGWDGKHQENTNLTKKKKGTGGGSRRYEKITGICGVFASWLVAEWIGRHREWVVCSPYAT